MKEGEREGGEFTLESQQKERIHGTIFDTTVDSGQDTDYRKTFPLKDGNLLVTYVDCDGPGCEFGKLEPQTFQQILSTLTFTD